MILDLEPILIRRSKDPFGWMGNMSPYPIAYGPECGYSMKTYRTTEALFQCMRFLPENDFVRDQIIAEKSPMAAKFVAKKYRDQMSVEPMSFRDLMNMNTCIALKMKQHPELIQMLYDTRGRPIVEDCTKRQRGSGLFWGAALIDGKWVGENWLGKIWEDVRK